MKRVLVTGSAGFIGSHLITALIDAGVQVVGLDYARPRFEDTVGDLQHSSLFIQASLDLTAASLDAVVDGADVVFHLAGKPGVRGSWGPEFSDYVTTNVLGTQRLLEACWRARTPRVVFASSSSVYGATAASSAEDDDCRPMSPYGVTKLAAEQLALAYARRHDDPLSVVALRYFTVYGPRQRPDMAFGRLLLAAYTGSPLTLFGDGSQRRDFTYVSDVVNATIAAGTIDTHEAIINVGGGASVSLIEAIDIAAEVAGRPIPLTAIPAQPGDVPTTRADLTLARQLLGYQPQVGIREGLTRQSEWLCGLPGDLLHVFVAEPAGSTP